MTDIPFNLTREGGDNHSKVSSQGAMVWRGGELIYEGKIHFGSHYKGNKKIREFQVYQGFDADLFYATCIMHPETGYAVGLITDNMDTAIRQVKDMIINEHYNIEEKKTGPVDEPFDAAEYLEKMNKMNPIPTKLGPNPNTNWIQPSVLVGGLDQSIMTKPDPNQVLRNTSQDIMKKYEEYQKKKQLSELKDAYDAMEQKNLARRYEQMLDDGPETEEGYPFK